MNGMLERIFVEGLQALLFAVVCNKQPKGENTQPKTAARPKSRYTSTKRVLSIRHLKEEDEEKHIYGIQSTV